MSIERINALQAIVILHRRAACSIHAVFFVILFAPYDAIYVFCGVVTSYCITVNMSAYRRIAAGKNSHCIRYYCSSAVRRPIGLLYTVL